MTLLAWAQAYAARGWPVVPLWGVGERGDELVCRCGKGDCDSAGKHPCGRLVPHGLTEATTDVALVTKWWEQEPYCNVGCLSGVAFDTLDVDHDDYAAGVADLPICETDGGPTVLTGSGRFHLLFATTGLPRRIRFSQHCDWLGVGGYQVMPPSRSVKGTAYRWWSSPDLPLTKPPVFLTNMVAPPRPTPPISSGLTSRRINGPTSTHNWSPAGLIGKVAAAADGERNSMLHWAATRIRDDVRGGRVDATTAANALDQLAVAAERAGLGAHEVDSTIRSGFRTAP